MLGLSILSTLLVCIVSRNNSEGKPSPTTTAKPKKGILVVIGGNPSHAWGAKFMKTQIPNGIKNNYIILSRNWKVLNSIDKLKADIKKIKRRTGLKKVYVIGFSKGGDAVFKLLQSYKPTYVGLIDPAIPANWKKSSLNLKITMIWGSTSMVNEFANRHQMLHNKIIANGGKSFRCVKNHFTAVKKYFKEYFRSQ